MSQDRSATTARLLELCLGYFAAYVFTGVLVKWFTVVRDPRLPEMTYLFNNTIGGSVLALGLVYERLGKLEEARDHYQEALKVTLGQLKHYGGGRRQPVL